MAGVIGCGEVGFVGHLDISSIDFCEGPVLWPLLVVDVPKCY